MKFSQAFKCASEHAFAAAGVMARRVWVIKADAESQRIRTVKQGFHLMEALYQRLGRIGQHQAGLVQQRVIENAYYILVDERFTPGEGKLFDAKAERLVHKGDGLVKA